MHSILKENRTWLLLWAATILVSLWARPPMPIDETRYLSVAWEMWNQHQFLIPLSNGHPYSHKPPLLFWLIHLSWSLFGVNAWIARLIAPLFGLGSILLTRRIAVILWPDRPEVSQQIPFYLLAMPIWLLYSSLTMFDSLVTFFALAALEHLVARISGNAHPSWGYLGLLTGLGLLAKGPVVLVFIGGPLLLAPWWASILPGKRRAWFGGCTLTLACACAILLSWALPAAFAGGTAYAQALFVRQTAGRIIQSFAHQRPFYWYLLLLPALLFPWSCWLPLLRRLRHLRIDPPLRFCLSCLLPAFLILSLVSGKQIHYLLPLMPILTLVMARIAVESHRHAAVDRWPLTLMLTLSGIVLFLLRLLPPLGNDADLLRTLPWWLGLIPLTAGLFIGRQLRPGSLIRPPVIAGSLATMFAAFHLCLHDPAHRLFEAPAIAANISRTQRQAPIAVYPARLRDQFQFAARLASPLYPQETLEEILSWSKQHPQGFCLLYLDRPPSPALKDLGLWQRYQKGWLMLAQAGPLHPDLARWRQAAHSDNQVAMELQLP